MTANEISTEVLKTYTGRLMREPRPSGFKLVVCLGPASGIATKIKVSVWSDNGETWSKPQARDVRELVEIDLAALTPRQRRTCQRAFEHITKNKDTVYPGKPGDPSKPARWSTSIYVGRPWFTKGEGPAPAAEGVTKLAPAKLTADPDKKAKLQNLNARMSNSMFGGRK